MRLACEVCACGERTRFGIRRPDSASTPRYASGGLASSKCKPSYMKRTRTACTVPPRTWCTTGGSLGIGGAFYGVLCRQWRTNPIFAKREIWGRNISPPLLKGPKRRFRLPGRSMHHSPLSPTQNRSPVTMQCLGRSNAASSDPDAPTRRGDVHSHPGWCYEQTLAGHLVRHWRLLWTPNSRPVSL